MLDDVIGLAVCIRFCLQNTFLNLLCQLGGVAVSRGVENRNQLSACRLLCRPRLIACQNLLHSAFFGQNRTVAGADVVRLLRQGFDFFQTLAYKGCKWTEDGAVVQLQSGIISLWISNAGIKGVWLAVVAAQKVAGEQGVCLFDPGEHRIRPVQVRCRQEGQAQTAQVENFSVLDLVNIQITAVGDIFQIVCTCNRSNQLCVWHQLQQLCQRTGVIRLVVVHNDIVNFLKLADFFDIFQILFKKALMAGFDQSGLFAASDQIGVVGGTRVGLHHNIKHPHIRVHDPYRVDSFGDFYCGHCTSSFLLSLS